MTAKYITESLDTTKHDRATFSCGVESLDKYLKEQASQDIKKSIARVYVLCSREASSAIIGYYSLSASTLETSQLPDDMAKKLPRYKLLPTILLGRLAISADYQGQKLGELLLVEALRRCLRISEELGAMAVLVDAKDEQAAQFYLRYGFRRFEDIPLTLFMPMAEIRKLSAA